MRYPQKNICGGVRPYRNSKLKLKNSLQFQNTTHSDFQSKLLRLSTYTQLFSKLFSVKKGLTFSRPTASDHGLWHSTPSPGPICFFAALMFQNFFFTAPNYQHYYRTAYFFTRYFLIKR